VTFDDEVRSLIDQINAKLEQATGSGELEAVLAAGDLPEARRLESVLEEADPDNVDLGPIAAARHVLGSLRWYRSQLVPDGAEDRAAALSFFRLPYSQGLADIPAPLRPELASRVVALAMASLAHAIAHQKRDQADGAIEFGQRVAGDLAADHPDRARLLAYVGTVLHLRFSDTGSRDDLDRAIAFLGDAFDAGDPTTREDTRLFLVQSLQARLTATADPADLERMIDLCATGVPAATDDEARVGWLTFWGDALLQRYERDGADADRDQAIEAKRSALAIGPTTDLSPAALRYGLAWALSRGYDPDKSSADLVEAIDLAETAARVAGPDDPFGPAAQRLLEPMREVHRRFGDR
jgi:tetratricopeptide (TPR) repeat protein